MRYTALCAVAVWFWVALAGHGAEETNWFAQLPLAPVAENPAAGDLLATSLAENTVTPSPVATPLVPSPQSSDVGVCPECHGFGPCCQCNRVWSVEAGAVVLHRTAPRGRTLVMDYPPLTGVEILNARSFDFGTEAGPTVTIARHFEDFTVELRYFGVDDWSRSAGPISTTTGVYVPLPTPYADYDSPYQVSAGYESDLHSLELNFTRPLGDRWGFIIGYRYLEVKESLLLHLLDVGPAPRFSADIGLGTKNRMDGFQLGVGGDLWNQGGRFRLEGTLKASVYSNLIRGTALINQDGGADYATTLGDRHTAFLGELELAGVYQLTRCLSVRAGYQLMWLEGVALASDQLSTIDATGGGSIDTDGSPFYHGLNASLRFVW